MPLFLKSVAKMMANQSDKDINCEIINHLCHMLHIFFVQLIHLLTLLRVEARWRHLRLISHLPVTTCMIYRYVIAVFFIK